MIEVIYTIENIFKPQLNKTNAPFYIRTVFRAMLDDDVRVTLNLQL